MVKSGSMSGRDRVAASRIDANAILKNVHGKFRLTLLVAALAALAMTSAISRADTLVGYHVVDGRIPAPLTNEPGDPARGKAAALSREGGNCFLCHSFPDAGETPLGNIGPPLAGVGARLNAAQLRLRLVDSTRINRTSVMPAYYRIEGLQHVAANYSGKPLLTPQQIEDVVAYLLTLR